MNPGSYNSGSEGQDQEEVPHQKKSKREKRKARHAVYRALPGYQYVFVPPGNYAPYAMPSRIPEAHPPVENPVTRPQGQIVYPHDAPAVSPSPSVETGPSLGEETDSNFNRLYSAGNYSGGLPQLQTVDVRVPPKHVPLYERRHKWNSSCILFVKILYRHVLCAGLCPAYGREIFPTIADKWAINHSTLL